MTTTELPRTAPPETRRKQLIDATITSISRDGISGTTMNTVTGLAGLSLGLVNFHFKSKDTLLEDTLQYLAEEHRAQWVNKINAPGLSAPEKLLIIVDAQFRPRICNRKKLTVWFAFYGEAAYRKSYRAIVTGIDAERLDVFEDLCAQIITEGAYETVTPEGVARTLEGLLDGFWLNMLMYPAKFSRAESKAQILAYLSTTFPKYFQPENQV